MTIMKRTIVFIGDSLTEFFNWQERFPAYTVYNLGVAGETVGGLLGRMESILEIIRNSGQDPDTLFIMTGINNIAAEDYEIIDSYRMVVRMLSSSFANAKLVIQSMLPVGLPWVDNRTIQGLNGQLCDIAREFRADYLDLYSFFISPAFELKKAYLLDDGVHLSEEGYTVWSAAIAQFLDYSFNSTSSSRSSSSRE